MSYLNLNWLLSRLLEKCGIDTYLARTEFAAHFFASSTFALLGIWMAWVPIVWTVWVFIDEFVFDGWKGKDTLIDLASKLIGQVVFLITMLL